MQEVGIYLRREALTNTGLSKDAFARSAYTRYYYACFLNFRTTLSLLNSTWSSLPHADYPKLLGGQILTTFKEEKLRARRRGDSELTKIIESAIQATKEVKAIFEEAYAIRVTADYKPHILINFISPNKFSLNFVDDNKAHHWFGRVDYFSKDILRAWREIHA